VYVFGDVQGDGPSPSRRQVNADGSLPVNVKVAAALVLAAGGAEPIVVCGAMKSTVQEY
jgi:hypothetical protein